jgi:hypothetical protein
MALIPKEFAETFEIGCDSCNTYMQVKIDLRFFPPHEDLYCADCGEQELQVYEARRKIIR